jgi:hypothetical protein
MVVQEELDLVRRGCTAVRAGDTATLAEMLAPDVVHAVIDAAIAALVT